MIEPCYFIFNNISSEDYLGIKKLPSIYKAERDITFIEVEGRDGFLTQDLGTYRSIIKTIECQVTDLSRIDYMCQWLTGSGKVIFSNEPDRVYNASIKNQIELSKIVTTYHTFLVQFDCQPHKYSINNNLIILLTAGTIFNNGTANSNPIVKIYGNGVINLTINGNVINLTNVSEYVTINSDLIDCYKDTLLKNNDMSGEFPVLIPGINAISWSGAVTKIEIIPNFRYL